jgi:hypothetical protein
MKLHDKINPDFNVLMLALTVTLTKDIASLSELIEVIYTRLRVESISDAENRSLLYLKGVAEARKNSLTEIGAIWNSLYQEVEKVNPLNPEIANWYATLKQCQNESPTPEAKTISDHIGGILSEKAALAKSVNSPDFSEDMDRAFNSSFGKVRDNDLFWNKEVKLAPVVTSK